ncbi:hypothetical protein JZ751_002123 [Albula glossodonta]|uniref:G-protein coupled receptors family 1 profile domain-containing protein n=1 Tax=Albula glossodonta TaxID=121402 RepID=A0A8T2PFX4_9TELE|nr:hypothetical protein JZ751_002123 [Albula glossodonta]
MMGHITQRLVLEVTNEEDYPFDYFDNYSYSLSNDTEPAVPCEREEELQAFYAVFQPLVYSLMFLLGMLGNGVMLAILLRRQARLHGTEIYLFHLALADLLLLFTFPFSVTEVTMGWIFGDILCKVLGMLSKVNFFCGVLLLACISFERYLAVVHAVRTLRGGRHPQSVHLTCFAVWLLSITLSTPHAAFLSVAGDGNDSIRLACHLYGHGIHDNNWLMASRFLTHMVGFILPLSMMSYCYTAVVLVLHRTQQKQRSLEKRRAVRLALVITAVFCLCWLPYNITTLMDTLMMLNIISRGSCEELTQANMALAVTKSLGYAHCCLNPLLYAFLGVRFRRELRVLSHAASCCWDSGSLSLAPVLRSQASSKISVSEGDITTN